MELFGETDDNCRRFFEAMLGPDWEERLILGGAVAGLGASNDDVDLARERAAVLVEQARPDIEWDEPLRNDVRRAWFALWVNNTPEALDGGEIVDWADPDDSGGR